MIFRNKFIKTFYIIDGFNKNYNAKLLKNCFAIV